MMGNKRGWQGRGGEGKGGSDGERGVSKGEVWVCYWRCYLSLSQGDNGKSVCVWCKTT